MRGKAPLIAPKIQVRRLRGTISRWIFPLEISCRQLTSIGGNTVQWIAHLVRDKVHKPAHLSSHELFMPDSCRLMLVVHHRSQTLPFSPFFFGDIAKLDDGAVLISSTQGCNTISDIEISTISIDKHFFGVLHGFVADLVAVDWTFVDRVGGSIGIERVYGVVESD